MKVSNYSTKTKLLILTALFSLLNGGSIAYAASEVKADVAISASGQGSNQKMIYGIAFSPIGPGQNPGSPISAEQVEARLDMVVPYVKSIRTFSSTGDHMKNIDIMAKNRGLEIFVGAWFSRENPDNNPANSYKEANEREFQAVVEMAKKGNVAAVILGSETLLRKDLTEEQLIAYIKRFKQEVPGVPVTTADVYDHLRLHPNLLKECDFVYANIYPFWEKIPVEQGIEYLERAYESLREVSFGKEIIVSETGWPSGGYDMGAAKANVESARIYFQEVARWSKEKSIRVFYFSSFDETWKSIAEGEVGKYWGIMNENGDLKPAFLPGENPAHAQ